MPSAIRSATRSLIESFQDSTSPVVKREIYADSVAVLLSFIIAFVLVAFLGKLLWNNIVTELFTFAKPARSFWQIIGLMIFINIIRP
jgi:hypothetical protein